MQETPMMSQYLSFKNQYPDKILLFRMGDFFETFGDDAKVTAKILNITLTARDKSEGAVPLAGFPHHALDQYLPKLIEANQCVVIVDQIEDPKLAKGIVKRAVTRIVTPGTLDNAKTEEVKNSYIAAFCKDKKKLGVCLIDFSVGNILFSTMSANSQSVETILNAYSPVEILITQHEDEYVFPNTPVQFVNKGLNNIKYSSEVATKFYSVSNINGLGIEDQEPAINALAMCLEYIVDTQKMKPEHVQKPKRINLGKTMILDRSTINNLELVAGSQSKNIKDSLFNVIDNTLTTMGRRLLFSWILNPLIDKSEIEKRLETVDALFKDNPLLVSVRESLDGINDIEKIVGKIGLNRANARDLKALQNSINKSLSLSELINGKISLTHICNKENIGTLKNISDLIDKSIIDNPPLTIMEGHIIKSGYNSEVDEIRELSVNSKDWLKSFENAERERTGINSLKVSYNKVFGYYIEVTKAHQSKVPSDYIRKQTLVNSERYITEELKEKESIILNAQDKLSGLEYKIFQDIRTELIKYLTLIQDIASDISYLDCLAGFAHLATTRSYVKPELYDFNEKNGILNIKDGRHPVIESISDDPFISNDSDLNMRDSKMIIITGPNMSGKSTYIRQVAIIVLLAQIGCFVPASRSQISLVDRIFTRVGASDDLARGRSTFMVEMNEAANILNNATKYSLVILDEVGRGTSTFDGVSIAWALAEYLINEVECRTLFATHYHELLKLSEKYPDSIKNYNVLVEEDVEKGTVIFLRKIVAGGTDRSYGIYVAKMAGLPEKVIARANQILEGFEQESLFSSGVTLRGEGIGGTKKQTKKEMVSEVQIPLFKMEDSEVTKMLRDLDVDSITPIEAINMLSKLKSKV